MLDPYAKEKHFTLKGCPDQCACNCFGCKVLMQAIDRLAAYEDTGLEPEKIVKMGMAWEDSKRYSGRLELKLKVYQDLGPIDHLRDLLQAESDGKLMIRPYEIDRVVWVVRSQTSNGKNLYLRQERIKGYNTTRYGTTMYFESGRVCVPHWDWEKTVFLTREEAETALEGGRKR